MARSRLLVCIVLIAVGLIRVAVAQNDPCAAGLVPNVDISHMNDATKYSYLELIDSSNYEAAKKNIKASADVDLLGLIKVGDADVSFDEFKERRSHFLSQRHTEYATSYEQARMRYYVPDSARMAYFNCVMALHGLTVGFKDEDSTHATAKIQYNGTPGTKVAMEISLAEGTTTANLSKLRPLASGGSFEFAANRSNSGIIRVIVNSNVSLSASAVSMPPPKPEPSSSTSPPKLPPSYDLCLFKEDENGIPYVKTFSYRSMNLNSPLAQALFKQELESRGFQVDGEVVSKTEKMDDSLSQIYSVTYACTGQYCGWSYKPHPAPGGADKYAIEFDLSNDKNSFTWHRRWGGNEDTEAYTVLYQRARRACVANCDVPDLKAPVCTSGVVTPR